MKTIYRVTYSKNRNNGKGKAIFQGFILVDPMTLSRKVDIVFHYPIFDTVVSEEQWQDIKEEHRKFLKKIRFGNMLEKIREEGKTNYGYKDKCPYCGQEIMKFAYKEDDGFVACVKCGLFYFPKSK